MPILTDNERISTSIAGGKYTLERILGRGGMGTVFEGVHTWTGRRVAIKLLRHDLASDGEASGRYLQEARAATSIEHPNVVEVLDMGRDDDATVYMVFELLRGVSLGDRLESAVRLSAMETAVILLPIADALAAAHRAGIVHRDIKPDNIFLEDDGMGCVRPKLLDFGIARIADTRAGSTHTGVITGTPEYMSPEHARGFRATPATDVWSLAVVLYECLTGTRPFDGENAVAVLMAVVSEPLPPLHGREELPEPIAALLERSFERNPSERLPDAAAFRDALAEAVAVECVPSRSRSVPPKLLGATGEIGLACDRTIIARRSTPSFERPSFLGLQGVRSDAAIAIQAASSGEQRLSGEHEPRRGPTDADATPTVDELPVVTVLPPRDRRPVAVLASAALLVVVLLFFGARLLGDDPRVAGDAATSNAGTPPVVELAPSIAERAESTSPAQAGARTAPSGSASEGVPRDEPPLPGSAIADSTARENSRNLRRGEPEQAAERPRETPPVAPRARATTAPTGRGPERGANGSLILD